MTADRSPHRIGCICGMSFFAPDLPERQAEMRVRMQTTTKELERARRQKRINDLCSANDWHAALIILTSDLLSRDGRVWRHVDLDRGSIDFPKILRDHTFSHGERALVEIAASLFSNQVKVQLWLALGSLDYRCSEIVLHAIRAYTGLSRS